jgi:predicted Rossmann-fold nucleotide-binding protein
MFEALTLIQVRKVRYFPTVFMGRDYWQGLLDWMHQRMLGEGKIGPADLSLLRVTDDPEEVVELVSAAADLQGSEPEQRL